jgi:phosphate/phosphite/phosphonate ABC transporter binding protein
VGERLVFGLVPNVGLGPVDAPVDAVLRWLGERAGVSIERRSAATYDALGRGVRAGAVHVAWLPPLLFVRLEIEGAVVPLVANERVEVGFVSALLVSAKSGIVALEELKGARAAWVDPLSTTGYVVPRLELAARGLDPRVIFRVESFYRSHAAAVRAVASEEADLAATYARLNTAGEITRGGWRDAGISHRDVRVLHVSAPLPPDLIAVRADLAPATRDALRRAFLALSEDSGMRTIAKRTLGVDGFAAPSSAGFDALRGTIEAAASSGLVEAAAQYISKPPPA